MRKTVLILLLIVLLSETVDASPAMRRLPPIIKLRKVCKRSANPGQCVEIVEIVETYVQEITFYAR